MPLCDSYFAAAKVASRIAKATFPDDAYRRRFRYDISRHYFVDGAYVMR